MLKLTTQYYSLLQWLHFIQTVTRFISMNSVVKNGRGYIYFKQYHYLCLLPILYDSIIMKLTSFGSICISCL